MTCAWFYTHFLKILRLEIRSCAARVCNDWLSGGSEVFLISWYCLSKTCQRLFERVIFWGNLTETLLTDKEELHCVLCWSLALTLSSSVVCAPGTVALPPDQERRSSPGTQLPGLNTPLLPQPHITWHFAFSSNLCLQELVGQLGVRSWLRALSYWGWVSLPNSTAQTQQAGFLSVTLI